VSAPRVSQCICFRRTFAELKRVAERTGARTVPELQRHTMFGMSCMLCVPYVQRMLETGETEFPLLPPAS
jgi:NAD(P)H-nitrite reductase large subunit